MAPIPVNTCTLILVLAGDLLGALLLVRLARMSPLEYGWRGGGWRAITLALGWGGLLSVLSLVWLRVLMRTGNYLPIPIRPSVGDLVAVVLLLPVVDGLFFQGAVLGVLQRGWRPMWALIFAAVVYTLGHAHESWIAFTALSGFSYAAAFRATRALVTPMIAHAIVSAVLLLARIHPAETAALHPALLVGAALGAMILILLREKRPGTEAGAPANAA